MAEKAPDNRLGKYDGWLSDRLVIRQYAARMLDVPCAVKAASSILNAENAPIG